MSGSCGRCGHPDRKRSPENLDRHKKYACCECLGIEDSEAIIKKYRREGFDIDIIIDYATTARLGIDILEQKWFGTSAKNKESVCKLVGVKGKFKRVAEEAGIETEKVDYWDERSETISRNIDQLSGENLTIILFAGKSISPAVKRLKLRSEKPVIVLSGRNEGFWANQGALTLPHDRLPRQRNRMVLG